MYELHVMKWHVKSMKRYVMISKLYVYSILWMTWHYDKWMKYNPVRIMHDMRTEKWENDINVKR